ncbi:MAG TPA: hypothetical protein V6C95_10075 [Coleofasciculaceae cyanobacterium]
MNTQYLATLTAIALAIGFSQSTAQYQSPQILLNPMLTEVFVQYSPLGSSLQAEQTSPPPVTDKPDDRTPAGTRITPIPDRGTPSDRKGGASRVSRS